jgi:hypothetical protein
MTLSRDELQAAGEWLDALYRSQDGLQRPNGLWIDGHPDWEGVAAWLLEVYVSWRLQGQSSIDAKAEIVRQIRQTGEWQAVHPVEPGSRPGPSRPSPRGPLPPLDPDDPPHPPEYPTVLRLTRTLPPPPPVTERRYMRGNFCGMRIPGLSPVKGGAADPSLVFTPFFDRYGEGDQDAIVAGTQARGYVDVKLSWPDSRDGHRQSIRQYVETATRLQAQGLRVTHMLLSKDFDGRNPDPNQLGPVLEALLRAGAADKVCCFWEGNLFIDPQPVIQRVIDFVTARTVPAGVLTYVHFSPGVIAWQKDGWTTADFWNAQVGKLTGLLHQVDPRQTAPQMQARLNDGLVRFGGGFNFPTDSGFGHPFDLVSDEVGASRLFNGASEDDGDKWGYEAICTPGPVPVMGFGNGARAPDGGVI